MLKVGRAAVNAVTRFDVEGFVEETTALTKSIDNCCNLVGTLDAPKERCFIGAVKKGVNAGRHKNLLSLSKRQLLTQAEDPDTVDDPD